MLYRGICGILTGLFLCATPFGLAAAQDFRPDLSFRLGLIRNLQTDTEFRHYSVYPELEATSTLLTLERTGLHVQASLYVGGWLDGVDQVSKSRDSNITHSCKSLIGGARFQLGLARSVFMLFGGVSRQFVRANYIGGTSIGIPGEDNSYGVNLAELGARISFRVHRQFNLGLGAQWYFHVPVQDDDPNAVRPAYTIGVRYRRSGI